VPNIAFREDLEPSEITRKDKMVYDNLEGTEGGHANADTPLRADGPDLPTSVSPRAPDNTATVRKYCSHGHRSKSQLPEASVEGKERKKKSRESEILPGSIYKPFIKSRKNGKASKMKERAERQL
jgi:hypothetical protein